MDQSVLSQYARCLNGIEYIATLDKGIERIKEVASWPDGKLPDETQNVFPAFCEYVAFNMGVKYPFFEALYHFLKNKEVHLFKHICDKDFKGYILTYDEAFEMFLFLKQDKVRDILDTYNKLPINTCIKILSSLEREDVSLFLEAFQTGDFSDFLCKLGLLRYILIGQEKGRITDEINKRHSLGQYSKWFKGCNWECYFVYYTPDIVKKRIKKIIFKRILGIGHKESPLIEFHRRKSFGIYNIPKDESEGELRITFTSFINEWKKIFNQIQENKVYYDGWINKWKSVLKNEELFSQKIENLSLRADDIVSKCESLSEDIMFMPFYSQPEAVKDHLIRYFGHSNMEWDYIDDDFDDESFGDYVFLMCYRIAEVYNYVSESLYNEELELLNWIIDRSNYKDVIRGGLSLIKLSENTFQNTCNDPIVDKYTNAIKKWKETNYPICNFQLTYPLSDEQLEKLFRGLETYISPRSTIQSLRHILGGNHFEGYEPIIWEPKSKNKTPHKKSVLNLLVRLGIAWKEIIPKKLNYCFITLDESGMHVPFASNNIKGKPKKGEENVKKRADSELDSEIKDLLEIVFDGDECHLRMMRSAKLVCDD